MSEQDPQDRQRLDKWLKIARIFKTRTQATHACEDRRVKVNGEVAKPARLVKPGDELTIKWHRGKFINLKITGLSHKSISAKEARELYEMDEKPLSEESEELLKFYREAERRMRPKYKGRPTKKERRRLEQFKQKHFPWA